jgi:rod shape-determining protein MreC
MAVFVIIFLAGTFYLFFPKISNEGIFLIAKPLWGAKDYLAQESNVIFGTAFSDKEKLLTENLSLQRQLDEARTSLLSLENYKKENEELKGILGRNTSSKKILGVVLSKPNRSIYDTLVIDVGTNNGIKKDDAVMFGDFMIGKVSEVYSDYSKVKLSSTYGEKNIVRVGNVNVDVEAEGRGGGNYVVRLPKDVSVTVGDLIKSVELGPKFFGKVVSIEKTETSSFQFILFKLPVNIYTLNWVEVISK